MAECTSQAHLHPSREVFSASSFVSKFSSHRPEEMKRPEAPFILAINHKRKPADPVWYSRAPLGKNKIGEFLTKAAKNAGLPENVTNHSVRKTCISRLMDAEIPVNYVAQRSGHNLKSLDSYKTASDEHQRKMLLSSGKKSPVSSNDAPLNQAVEASQHPFKPREDKQASSGEDPFTGFFAGSNISKFEGCTFNFSFNTAPCSSSESSARSKPRKRHIIISDDSDSD